MSTTKAGILLIAVSTAVSLAPGTMFGTWYVLNIYSLNEKKWYNGKHSITVAVIIAISFWQKE